MPQDMWLEDDFTLANYTTGNSATSAMDFSLASENFTFTAEGNLSLLPTKRNYTVELHGFQEVKEKQLEVIIENQIIETKISFDENRNAVVVQIPETSVTKEICIRIDKEQKYLKNNVMKHVFDFLNQAEIKFFLKDQKLKNILS